MTIVDCDQLFDGRALRGPSRLRFEDGRITTIEPRNGSEPAADVSSPFVMPGLIDCHVHVSGYREGMPAGAPFEPHKHFLRLCVYAGVTTIRDTGNSLETLAYVREWGERFAGPRVVGSGPILDQPPLTWPFSRLVRNREEAERTVTQLAAEGVDWIKAYRGITPEVLGFIVAAAREHDLPVAVDCGRTTSREASLAGVRSLEHLSNFRSSLEPPSTNGASPGGPIAYAKAWSGLDPASAKATELIDVLLAHGTAVCPTLLVARRWCLLEEMVADPYLEYAVPVMPYHRYLMRMRSPVGLRLGRRYLQRYMPMPTLDRDERRAVEHGLDRLGETMVALHEAGVPLVAGTDSPNPSLVPGFSLHQELAQMQRHGLAAPDVLASATGRAGDVLGRPDLGVLEPGACADLLCVEGDPSRDVEELGRVERVLVRGAWVDRTAVAEKLREAMAEATS